MNYFKKGKGLVVVAVGVLFSLGFGGHALAKEKGSAGYWKFDEGKGNIAKDSSGKGNDGKIHNATWAEGKVGKALFFNGADAYVDCGNDKSLNITNAITIEAWVKRKSLSGGSQQQVVVDKLEGGSGQYAYYMGFYLNDEVILWSSENGTLAGKAYLKTTNTFTSTTAWYHLVGTIDSGTFRIYVNGVEESGTMTGSNSAIFSSTSNLHIGSRAGNYAFNGAIDEVKIYNYVLPKYKAKGQKYTAKERLSISSPLKRWAHIPPMDTHYQQAIIKDGIYYGSSHHGERKILAINIHSGAIEHSLDISSHKTRAGCACAPWIAGDYMYFYVHAKNKVYKIVRDSFDIEATWTVHGNVYAEVVPCDSIYFYLPESTPKVTKRKLTDGTVVATFSPRSPKIRGILMLNGYLYFKTSTEFYCVRKTDLTEVWSIPLDFTEGTYSTPSYDSDNNLIYIANTPLAYNKSYLYAIDPGSGKVKWKKHYPSYGICSTPMYHNNRIFVPLFYYHGIEALNPADGSVIWSKTYDNDYGWCSGALDDKYIYRGSSRAWGTSNSYNPYYFQMIRQSDGELVYSEPINYSGLCAIAVISDGMCILPTRGAIIGFKIGSGNPVDYYPFHGNIHYTGYKAGAITYPFK